jgi:hypothetical protein
MSKKVFLSLTTGLIFCSLLAGCGDKPVSTLSNNTNPSEQKLFENNISKEWELVGKNVFSNGTREGEEKHDKFQNFWKSLSSMSREKPMRMIDWNCQIDSAYPAYLEGTLATDNSTKTYNLMYCYSVGTTESSESRGEYRLNFLASQLPEMPTKVYKGDILKFSGNGTRIENSPLRNSYIVEVWTDKIEIAQKGK